jgi:hypothetical protein
MSTDLPSQINSEISNLDAEKQRQVLAYVRTLKDASKGISGAELKQFAGTISPEDAKSMMDAIETGCGQVDPDGW